MHIIFETIKQIKVLNKCVVQKDKNTAKIEFM